jgi:hypothetical protein
MEEAGMDYEQLFTIADRARSGRRLTLEESAFIRDTVPKALGATSRGDGPKRINHPGGFALSGAPVRTFVSSALLLAGQKVFGKRYDGSPFYQDVERDLAFGIMRSHFHHGYPKGTHCCVQCSLAVYPVLETGAIRYFDCAPLAQDLKRLIETGGWRFATPPNPKMVRWALAVA